ncbi:helix-turn-helix domain-containing protein [Isoptericola sp. NEAU-Y5]|uniref:Helix-turn-helix domain-containing protein n=1 Tax=Isoptericola luteus TaxID=2879484 RepID=A0ABS7ZIJ3_9MICO|nr:helix-turn-helix domain-containing protein [Isoptericola sp. NEAU-Y5]MCA5894839.1 helix-turn-helix domain-containing protein [Isoptericola sp. NEAU-Y5]
MDAQLPGRAGVGRRTGSHYGNVRRAARISAGHAGTAHPPSDGWFVSLAVAADLVGVSVKTLRRRITAHVLPAYRLGGGRLIRVNLDEVREALLIPYDDA